MCVPLSEIMSFALIKNDCNVVSVLGSRKWSRIESAHLYTLRLVVPWHLQSYFIIQKEMGKKAACADVLDTVRGGDIYVIWLTFTFLGIPLQIWETVFSLMSCNCLRYPVNYLGSLAEVSQYSMWSTPQTHGDHLANWHPWEASICPSNQIFCRRPTLRNIKVLFGVHLKIY